MVFDWLARRVVAGLHLNRFYLEAMIWPELEREHVDQLAAAAAAIVSMSPRYKELKNKPLHSPERVTSTSRPTYVLSRLVAVCLRGLSAQDVAAVLSPDPSDRRGFWGERSPATRTALPSLKRFSAARP